MCRCSRILGTNLLNRLIEGFQALFFASIKFLAVFGAICQNTGFIKLKGKQRVGIIRKIQQVGTAVFYTRMNIVGIGFGYFQFAHCLLQSRFAGCNILYFQSKWICSQHAGCLFKLICCKIKAVCFLFFLHPAFQQFFDVADRFCGFICFGTGGKGCLASGQSRLIKVAADRGSIRHT